METTGIPVFMSLGRTTTELHERFIGLVFDALVSRQLAPVTLDQSRWTPDDPLRAIHDLMRGCSGVLVIALPRLEYRMATEFPDSAAPIPREPRLVPTIWNQIEASLGYTMKRPLLSLVDDRIYTEALLNPRHASYNALTFDLQACQFELPPYINQCLDNFAEKVIKHFRRRQIVKRDTHP